MRMLLNSKRTPEALVSVIIPAYNAEKTLVRTISSINKQDYTNYEVLIINDGSTDSTKELAESYASRDERIIAISQENRGLGATRNLGIQYANGKIIALLDADDEFLPGTLSRVVKAMESTDIDIVASDFIVTNELGNKRSSAALLAKPFPGGKCYKDNEALNMFCDRVLNSYCPTYFYRKEYLINNEVSFPEPGRFLEDIVFLSQVFSHYPRVYCLSGGPTYAYYMRDDSLTHNRGASKANLALKSIEMASAYLADAKHKDSFILEELLFAYYLATEGTSIEEIDIRDKITGAIRKVPASSLTRISIKNNIKYMLIRAGFHRLINWMYR